MPWYIYSLARGSVFYWGAAALVMAVLSRAVTMGRLRRALVVISIVLAVILIAISAAPFPYWFYCVWGATTIAWLIAPLSKSRQTGLASIILLLGMTAAAVAIELAYDIRPSPPSGTFSRVYVVGDSISAGIGAEHGQTWPVLIRAEHHVEVVDLSHAGATIADALQTLTYTNLSDGLVFLEIGGNDTLRHADADQFSADLESLVAAAEGPGRKLVMIEIPLLPFQNGYGIAQRKIARRHQITLIPKRLFVDILQTPGATVDGIHLSSSGQRQFAEMVWSFIGNSLRQTD